VELCAGEGSEVKFRNKPFFTSLAAILGPLLAIWAFVLVVDWVGERRWTAVKSGYEAAGESFDGAVVFREAIPNAENYCANEFLFGLAGADAKAEEKQEMLGELAYPPYEFGGSVRRPSGGSGYEIGVGTDFEAWAAYMRDIGEGDGEGEGVEVVLEGLSAYDELFDQLRERVDRPGAQFQPSMRERFAKEEVALMMQYRHLNGATSIVKLVGFRARAAVEAGDREMARESLAICLRLSEAIREERVLLSQLVAVTQSAILLLPVWDALKARIFDEEDLAWLAKELARIDYADSLAEAMRGETVLQVQHLGYVRDNRWSRGSAAMLAMGGVGASGGAWWEDWPSLIPNGWFDENLATSVDWTFAYMIRPLESGGFAAARTGRPKFDREVEEVKRKRWLQSYLARQIYPVFASMIDREAYLQDVIDRAEVAVALERFFLKKGFYPEAIEELIPEYLASAQRSPVDGSSIQYRRDPVNDRYLVYSFGWDGVDDAGFGRNNPIAKKFSSSGTSGPKISPITKLSPSASSRAFSASHSRSALQFTSP